MNDYTVLLDWVDNVDEGGYLVVVGAESPAEAIEAATRLALRDNESFGGPGTELTTVACFHGDLRDALINGGVGWTVL